ncbi:MAG: RAMP superfamily CRISPR-associated protein [Verrucomicrobia bacterium]|nr:RAMP superfamily CRISPR-associated protein [Verrucomicrobiota bacterium]
MVNMAGGVMENAGLCLDRFGMPYIPGSAVKGCARRAALAALHEWCETGQKQGATEQDKDNLFKNACAPFDKPAEMLVVIARVFGWCEQDWKTRADFRNDEEWEKKRPDYAWCCGDRWDKIRDETLILLRSARAPGVTDGTLALRNSDGEAAFAADDGRSTRAARIKSFAGSVSVLEAYPVDVPSDVKSFPMPPPPLGKLELDVVTVHHKEYYAEPDREKKPREWAEWNRKWSSAPDTEDPVPNVFPAVAAGHVFTFAIVPLRGADSNFVEHARIWLKTGLETFGLGAKTNAGYGWFADVTVAMRAQRDAEKEEKAEKRRQAQAKAGIEAARANLQPDPALLEKLRAMKEPDLRGQINTFATEERFWTQKDECLQLTVLHFFLVTAPDLFAADRANPKSKIAKAIVNLATKFPRIPPKCP